MDSIGFWIVTIVLAFAVIFGLLLLFIVSKKTPKTPPGTPPPLESPPYEALPTEEPQTSTQAENESLEELPSQDEENQSAESGNIEL